MISLSDISKLHDFLWEIPKNFRSDMRVSVRIFTNKDMLSGILSDKSLEQLINVATLPDIQKYALAMPDIHEGYGFPIGGVAATAYPNGAISPGGIGYDINCGVRLLVSELSESDIQPFLEKIATRLYEVIPSGVGRGGKIKLSENELNDVLQNGMQWAIKKGYASDEDAEHIESRGFLESASAANVSDHAKKRGHDQLGTIGAGNHFVEVGIVDEIYDEDVARMFGLFPKKIVVLLHTGSRGLGHQVATDYIRLMLKVMPTYNITLPDRELACVPFSSKEGSDYFSAMSAAAHFAWVNRQIITWEIRSVWKEIFQKSPLKLLYDVAHNMAKIEEYEIDGKVQKVIVHRKGATRAFPKSHKELPLLLRESGQPVFIPGSMGTESFVLVGTEKAMQESFGSSCHGAGRSMSRHAAKKEMRGDQLLQELKQKGIIVKAGSIYDLPEEAPYAYKDVDAVVEVVVQSGIAKKVAKLTPLVVIKG